MWRVATREGEGNWNIGHKKTQELNPNILENYHLNSTGVCVSPLISFYQWRTQELCLGGAVKQIQLRTEDGDLGAIAP